MEACKYCNASISDDEYATALGETIPTSDESSLSGANVSGADQQQGSEFATAVAAEIEASKVHWSELTTELGSDGEEQEEQRKHIVDSNREVFRNLVKRTTVSGLFNQIRFINFLGNDDFVLGEKIAEGGQAEIYLVKPRAEQHLGQLSEVVMKVFKLDGAPLQDLQHQLPKGFVNNPDHAHCSCIYGVRLLDDGGFAFQMMRYWGDLKKLIDLRMQDNHHQSPPFTMIMACVIVREICRGDARVAQKKCYSQGLESI